MKRFIKKNIIAIIVSIGIFIFTVGLNISLMYFYDSNIFVFKQFDINSIVYDNGDMLINERITVEFESDSNGEFWRDIVTDKNNNGYRQNTSSINLNTFVMKIYSEEGHLLYDSLTEYRHPDVYNVGYSWKNDRDAYGDLIEFEGYNTNGVCAYSYVPTYQYKTRIYEFSYVLEGFVTCYNDIAEINNNFFEPVESIRIDNVSVNIIFAGLNENSYNNLELFTHKSVSKDKIINNNSISYKIEHIYPGDAIESRVLFPTSAVSNIRSNNKINDFGYETLKGQEDSIKAQDDIIFKYGNFIVIIVFLAAIALFVIVIIKAYNKYDKELESDFKQQYLNDLPASYPPAVMGYLINFKEINKEDLTATLMDLIRRKYIDVDYLTHSLTEADANYTLKYNREKPQYDLTDYEKYTLQWFFDVISSGSDILTLDQLDEYVSKGKNAKKYFDCNDKWKRKVNSEAKKYKFFDETVANKAGIVYGFGLGIVGLIGLIGFIINFASNIYITLVPFLSPILIGCCLIGMSYLTNIKRRTKAGNEDYVRWMAFKNFLSDFGNMKDYPIPALIIWEHYLVYATSFGIAELVSQQLKLRFKAGEIIETPVAQMADLNRVMHYRMNRMYINAHTSYAEYKAKQVSKGGSRMGGGSSFGGGGGGARGR